jgi:hypothetical protein
MKIACGLRKAFFSICFFVASILLSGCGATEQTSKLPEQTENDMECRPASTEKCDLNDEKDRSYDPCLINKNLPVCKL